MSALVRKEFRLLLPSWIAALAAATYPLWSGRVPTLADKNSKAERDR